MPELPEVETTRRGIEPYVIGHKVTNVIVRDRRLRWAIPQGLEKQIAGGTVIGTRRRAKYLLIDFDSGCLLVHLGMSGSLRMVSSEEQPRKHDHVDIEFCNGLILRYHDPRRFGSIHWLSSDSHALLDRLGPEPLSDAFDGEHLYQQARRRSSAVKLFIMDAKIVVGVGNIYANEALFMAGIRPDRPANRVSKARYDDLATAIKDVLATAIDVGGTTLRDFSAATRRTSSIDCSSSRRRATSRTSSPAGCCCCSRRSTCRSSS